MNQHFKTYLESLTPKKRDLACEAVAEYMKGESANIERVSTAANVYNLCRNLALLDHEVIEVLCLNHNWKLLKRERIAQGGLTEVAVDVRVIMREALLCKSTIIMCVHNHPSGSLKPSRADDMLTENIRKACEIMRIHFADHVIIADGAYYSYHEQGRL